jgi:hypothetical protein
MLYELWKFSVTEAKGDPAAEYDGFNTDRITSA